MSPLPFTVKKKQVCMFTVVAFFLENKNKRENTMMSGPISLWRIKLSPKKLEAKMFVKSYR